MSRQETSNGCTVGPPHGSPPQPRNRYHRRERWGELAQSPAHPGQPEGVAGLGGHHSSTPTLTAAASCDTVSSTLWMGRYGPLYPRSQSTPTKCRISRHFGVTNSRGVFQPHLTGATGVSPPHVTNWTTRRAYLASQMGFAASRPRSGPSPHPTSAAAAAAEPSGAAQPAGRAAGDVLDGVEECRWVTCADVRRPSPRYRPA